MIVGEGPGATEDEQGKPFVGRSGQLLDQILDSAGFDSQNNVYVTNSVFRRPPNNRDPDRPNSTITAFTSTKLSN